MSETGIEVLKRKMPDGKTVREYLKQTLLDLWTDHDVLDDLFDAFPEGGTADDIDYDIQEAIKAL